MTWSDEGSEKPGSTLRMARKVRIISTAPISSTSAMDTWATTSRLRPRCRSRLTLAVRSSEHAQALPRREHSAVPGQRRRTGPKARKE
jgi:hypothetical protein